MENGGSTGPPSSVGIAVGSRNSGVGTAVVGCGGTVTGAGVSGSGGGATGGLPTFVGDTVGKKVGTSVSFMMGGSVGTG